ncbi:histidinol-phosphate transaminase [Patescibacteria group bacterium AH-259-L07]|nr:histidinol-phosphate transaminase [Patescibacteria group bacterium AH-259-L07]
MRNLALKRIQRMQPYKPPLDGRSAYGGMLLDFNEKTKPMQSKIVRALEKFVRSQKLQVYPEYFDLEKRIADYAGVMVNQVMITNGSDQGIDIIFRTFAEKGDTVIIPSPSFAMFYQCAHVIGNEIICPLYKKDDLAFPFEEVLRSLDEQTKLIVVCNPNSPTGTAVSTANIEKIVQKAKSAIVYVDEAYFEFSKITAVPLIKKYPNIIITRTFSKAFGLASLRIGYVIARTEYIAEMLKVRGPYDVNMAAYYSACAALEDRKSMECYVNEVIKKAKPLVEKFFDDFSIPYFQSSANFILFRPDNPKNVMKLLGLGGALVRSQNKQNIENTLRVSIGTVAQMEKFIRIYKKAILRNTKQKYAFLDRDGTLIYEPQDTYQIDSLKKLKILNGVIAGLQELKKRGYALIMISNQDGLGTSSFPQKSFEAPQEKMLRIFRSQGITFDQIFICPHVPNDGCNCRKPKTGLVDKFLRNVNRYKKLSFVCGDRDSDRQFAENIGITFIPMKTNGNFHEAIKSFLTNT